MWKRAWIIWKNNAAGGAEPRPRRNFQRTPVGLGLCPNRIQFSLFHGAAADGGRFFYASLCCIYASSACASTEFVVRANARPIVRQLVGESSGAAFRRKRLYAVMVRFVVPVMMLILFLQSTGIMA